MNKGFKVTGFKEWEVMGKGTPIEHTSLGLCARLRVNKLSHTTSMTKMGPLYIHGLPFIQHLQ